MNLEQIIGVLEKATHVLVAAHVSPDGDAIGAMAGMGHILEALGKSYTILMDEVHPKMHYITDHVNVASAYEGNYDVFVSVDCGDVRRLGTYAPYLEKSPVT
ncbi:MAG: DHH family phosphoesterase, partial [Cellulosilyticaceae bacterium]